MAPPYIPLEERFWKKVRKTRGCWEWTSYTDRDGYGQLGRGGRASRHDQAHRISWELHFGKIPAGLLVCHHCDNPSCVRPDHLFISTPLGNMRDMDTKKRRNTSRGIQHGMAKLTNADVLAIRDRYAAGGIFQQTLADEYGVTKSIICRIIRRKLWRHLT